ncbi:helix-turn-helix domain-containing protein [Virgibacillus sp. NKC19-16]|uniref:helix-turn-helix domain-containing protein n=1 Tax=Virgibacillus salidurans TaxID=2831673 RepID=UPI001F3BC655|nr:helix-turn-helix domain-containing protein [Virgibacillus sp. NKC19-16]UJL47994.1 helix-turn-helix domain-containing protein [Virgibacillus sp. NKC19-16]
MEIGERLREARETKSISLDSLQETTKIQKRYLVAIEEGNFHILPGKFYARAFIKEYANAVGLDPNELLEEYKEEVPKTEDENDAPYTRIQRTRKESNAEKSPAIFSLMPTIIVVLLVIGIILAAWFFYTQATSGGGDANPQEEQNDNEEIIINNPDDDNQNNNEGEAKESTEEAEDTEDSTSESEEEEEEQSEVEFSLVEEGAGSPPESTFDLTNAGEEITLTLESSGNTWLDVQNGDGESFYSQEFPEDESPLEFDMSGEERIYLSIGNAPDLTISINGTELEYPIDPNEEVFQKIWINTNSET